MSILPVPHQPSFLRRRPLAFQAGQKLLEIFPLPEGFENSQLAQILSPA